MSFGTRQRSVNVELGRLLLIGAAACGVGSCTRHTAPEEQALSVTISGRLERGATIAVGADIRGTRLSTDSTRVSWNPKGALVPNSAGKWTIAVSGLIDVTVDAAGFTAETSVVAAIPPTVVFDLVHAGNRDVYAVHLDGLDMVKLTDHPSEDFDPAVSGDSSVYFVSTRDGVPGLYRTHLGHNNPERLTPPGIAELQPSVDWSGQRVATVRTIGGQSRLWLRDASQGTNQAVETGEVGHAEEFSPTLDHEASRLVYVSTSRGRAELITLRLVAGARPALIFPSDSTARQFEPNWDRSGTRLVFTRSHASSGEEIVVYDYQRRLIQAVLVAGDTVGQPTWTGDGRIVYTQWDSKGSRLKWLDPEEAHDSARTIAVPFGSPSNATVVW